MCLLQCFDLGSQVPSAGWKYASHYCIKTSLLLHAVYKKKMLFLQHACCHLRYQGGYLFSYFLIYLFIYFLFSAAVSPSKGFNQSESCWRTMLTFFLKTLFEKPFLQDRFRMPCIHTPIPIRCDVSLPRNWFGIFIFRKSSRKLIAV